MRLIAEIKLFGEKAVAWSAPRTIQARKRWVNLKDKNLIAWQDSLRAAHREQHGQEPFCGAVMTTMTFHRQTDDKTLWGKRWWFPTSKRGHPDVTNLEKAAEDAITTFRQYKGKLPNRVLVLEIPGIIENDSQVCDKFGRKRWGPEDGVEIKVYAIEEE